MESVDEPPQSLQYEELLEVVTHAVHKLKIDRPAEQQTEPRRGKLDIPLHSVSHSTVKVHVAVLSAYHSPLDGNTVGKQPLVIRFLCGALRMRPPVRSRVPTWDLAVVLEALCKPPFEPIEEISDRHLSLKTTVLLAITSLKRVGDLQALSVAPSYLDFAPGLAKAFLYPRAGYTPKVPITAPRPVILHAFHPPPFWDSDQAKLKCMCPVRALEVSLLPGLPATKHTTSTHLSRQSRPVTSPLASPCLWGSRHTPLEVWHTPLEVWRPPRPSLQVSLFWTSATLRVGPPHSPLSGSTA